MRPHSTHTELLCPVTEQLSTGPNTARAPPRRAPAPQQDTDAAPETLPFYTLKTLDDGRNPKTQQS
jgi:hypothetical protein